MRRLTIIASMVLGALGILAIPSSALANSDCSYATSGSNSALVGPVPVGSGTVTVYEGGGVTGGATAAAGVCADGFGTTFDGGYAEAGAGEDPATGAADPGVVANQPDGYAVIDGSDQNVDPTNQGDGYIGVSNWETGASKASSGTCDTGAAGSSNSGGCLGFKPTSTYVFIPGDLPMPVCGNTSGDSWNGSGLEGPGDRDGCSIP